MKHLAVHWKGVDLFAVIVAQWQKRRAKSYLSPDSNGPSHQLPLKIEDEGGRQGQVMRPCKCLLTTI